MHKIIQDTVHGYIRIDEKYVDNFIDTIYFQRLRRIEQTSMRSLFPCARHDRFTHSLGVFYLGCKTAESIISEDNNIIDINDEQVKVILESFKVACLLHDCGHSPFSHTFEKEFSKNKLRARLKEVASCKLFEDEFERREGKVSTQCKEHEIMSAILILTVFREAIESIGADPVKVARMVIGCKYKERKDSIKIITNCFITILSGKLFDVDKLDYLLRDAWASGVYTNSIDVDRVLTSIKLFEETNQIKVCFSKSAISAIESIAKARIFQKEWMHPHPKVLYDTYILKKSVEKLTSNLRGDCDNPNKNCNIFDIEAFFGKITVGNLEVYLPTDDDIVYMLKIDANRNEYAREWLSRKHAYKPVWKSYNEFCFIFKNISSTDEAKHITIKSLHDHGCEEKTDFITLDIGNNQSKIRNIATSDSINILFDNEIIPLSSIIDDTQEKQKHFFYLYTKPELRDKIRAALRKEAAEVGNE